MKILMIEPPPISSYGNLRVLGSFGAPKCEIVWAPLDLMMIGGALKKHGFDFEIFDASATFASLTQVKDKIREVNPDIVIFTTSLTTIDKDLALASIAKQIRRGIVTVAFGTPIMTLPEEFMGLNSDLDIAVFGEPELPILDLVENDLSAEGVKGICYRKNSALIKNAPHPLCQNLDEFGIPAHDKVPFKLYRDPMMKRRPMTLTAAQRGCINACIFCCNPLYGNFRKRSVGNVIEELRFMMDLGIKELNFFDAGMTHDHVWSNALFERMINEKIDITWKGNSRANRLTKDMASKMKMAGCHTVQIGAESADLTVLKNIGKNVTPEEIRTAVNIAKKAGLNVLVYFSFGWPGETKESMARTVRFAKSLKTDLVTFGHASPHPGTVFYEYIEKHGFFNTREWEKFDPLFRPVFDYPNLTSDEMHAMVNQAYKSFYLRPGYMLRRALSIRSFLEMRNNMVNFGSFISRYVFPSRVKIG